MWDYLAIFNFEFYYVIKSPCLLSNIYIAIFLGRHLVSLYYKSVDKNQDEQLDMDILRDYIAYAKQTFNPKITDEAGALLTQSYVNMRQIGAGRGQITAYPR